MDAQARGAALFLLVAPGFLAEVGSQNIALLAYLSPGTFVLGSLAYGVPVLVIREIAAARGLSAAGIAVLGLAYGILNEGVIARTLTQAGGAPLLDFAGYGQVGPLQVGWAIFIVTWHALHSVLYPILLAHWLFPAAAGTPWFASGRARWMRYAMGVVMAALYALYFVNPPGGDVGIFLIYAVATAVIALVALRFRRGSPGSDPHVRSWPALLGMGTILLYLGAFAAPTSVPFSIYALAVTAAIALGAMGMRRAGWRAIPELLRFGLGDYLAFAVLAGALSVATGREPVQGAVAAAAFVVIFGALLRATARCPLGRGTDMRPATVATEEGP